MALKTKIIHLYFGKHVGGSHNQAKLTKFPKREEKVINSVVDN